MGEVPYCDQDNDHEVFVYNEVTIITDEGEDTNELVDIVTLDTSKGNKEEVGCAIGD